MSQITSFSSIKPSMLRVKSSIYIVWPPILLLKLELLNVHRKGPPNNKSVALTVRFVEDSSIVRQNIIWGPGRISKAQAHAGGPPLRDCQAVPRKKGKGCHWRCSWLGLKPEGWWDEDPWAFVFFFFSGWNMVKPSTNILTNWLVIFDPPQSFSYWYFDSFCNHRPYMPYLYSVLDLYDVWEPQKRCRTVFPAWSGCMWAHVYDVFLKISRFSNFSTSFLGLLYCRLPPKDVGVQGPEAWLRPLP